MEQKRIITRKEYSGLVFYTVRQIRNQAAREGKPVSLREAADEARRIVAEFYEKAAE